jgi:hypothetical protein
MIGQPMHRLKIVSETEAILCYDPKFLLPVGDPKSDFATAVMGVFTESLSIAAAHYGFAVKKRRSSLNRIIQSKK